MRCPSTTSPRRPEQRARLRGLKQKWEAIKRARSMGGGIGETAIKSSQRTPCNRQNTEKWGLGSTHGRTQRPAACLPYKVHWLRWREVRHVSGPSRKHCHRRLHCRPVQRQQQQSEDESETAEKRDLKEKYQRKNLTPPSSSEHHDDNDCVKQVLLWDWFLYCLLWDVEQVSKWLRL